MDINNNNQQVNTFVKGMNTDVSDSLMDSSQYRYAENLRIATNKDENSGELRLIEGNKRIDYDKGNIKAMTSIRNILIVVTKDDKIYKKDITADKNWKLVFQPADDEQLGEHLSLVTRWENTKDIKLYIADDINGLMYVNLSDSNNLPITGINNITGTIRSALPQINVSLAEESGTLRPAKVQYAYRLYKEGGAATTLSPLSQLITLYDGNKGYNNTIETSNKAVSIQIDEYTSSELNKIQIYRINYIQVGQFPEVNLVYDGDFTKEFTYVDKGYNIQSVAFEEFLSMILLDIKPKIIESKGDYLFAANVKYSMDDVDEQLKGLDSRIRIYSYGDYDDGQLSSVRNYNLQFTSDNIKVYNSTYWEAPPGSYSEQIDGSSINGHGEYISWRYDYKDVYIFDDNTKRRSETGSKIYEPLNSLRQGEVYRYGAVFYREDGKKSSVKWLCDIMAPRINYSTYRTDGGQIVFHTKQIGILFNIKKLPEGFVGVEIVRCERTLSDKITLTQGVAGFPYEIYTRTNSSSPWQHKNVICAPYLLSDNKFKFDPSNSHEEFQDTWAESDNDRLVVASPEYMYQPDDIESILQSKNLEIQLVDRRWVVTQTGQNRTLVNEAQEGGDFNNSVAAGYSNSASHDAATAVNTLASNTLVQVLSYKGDSNANYWTLIPNDNGIKALSYDLNAAFWSIYSFKNTPPLIVTHDVPNVSFCNTYAESTRMLSNSELITRNVTDIAFTKSPDYTQFLQSGAPNYSNSSVNIGSVQYINWSVPLLYAIRADHVKGTFNHEDNNVSNYHVPLKDVWPIMQPAGSTGQFILLELSSQIDFQNLGGNDEISVPIINIRNTSSVPYGGYNSIDNSTYLSFGNYKYGTGTISVFDGDCYPGIFEFNVQHAWFDADIITKEGQYYNGVRQACVYKTPIESDIDLSATHGDLYSRLNSGSNYYIQDLASSFDGYTQSRDAYLYNTAYSIVPDNIVYTATRYSSITDTDFDCRVHYSNVKTNGETIDNWLQFSSLNYLDVDSRFGCITNLRLFKDKLLFWQNNATGVLSVNERTVLNDIDNNNIIVGSGDVLARYDYISTIYGMKENQYEAEVQSNYNQYWWDGNNKEILAYSAGMQLTPLAKQKGLTNYINQKSESEHPCLAYDGKYDEVLAQVVKGVNNDGAIVFNEQMQQFSSIYTFTPLYRATIGKDLYLANKSAVYKQNDYSTEQSAELFDSPAFPKLKYVINPISTINKTFDTVTFGGRFYGGSQLSLNNRPMYFAHKDHSNAPMENLIFKFTTPLKQESEITGDHAVSINEYDFRLAIPRDTSKIGYTVKENNIVREQYIPQYGNRMRGKTMQCELISSSNSTDFSLQYIITKFRVSWG